MGVMLEIVERIETIVTDFIVGDQQKGVLQLLQQSTTTEKTNGSMDPWDVLVCAGNNVIEKDWRYLFLAAITTRGIKPIGFRIL